MKITRHPVDLERIMNVFQWQREHLEESLEGVRKEPNGLYSFFLNAETIYLAGSVLAPDSPEVARALMLAAQAGTALFVFQRIECPPQSFILGEGPPVIYARPAGRSCADFLTWKKAFHLCLITRESQLSDKICEVPNEAFRYSDLISAADADYRFADILRVVWTKDRFTHYPAFLSEEAEYRQASGRTPWARYVRCLAFPYLQVLKQLEQLDEVGFAVALTEGLQGHKEFWSLKKYRDDFNGLVSLPLTAVAALAWVRGDHFCNKKQEKTVM